VTWGNCADKGHKRWACPLPDAIQVVVNLQKSGQTERERPEIELRRCWGLRARAEDLERVGKGEGEQDG